MAILGLAVGGGFIALGRNGSTAASQVPEPKVAKPAVAVVLEPVTARAVRRAVHVVGPLYGREEVTITPKVEGRVLKIHHDVGDVVKPGDTLLELDPVDYRLAATEARRGLELELAKLGLKELPTSTFDVNRLPSVVRAVALERNAATRRDRVLRLGSGGASSAEEREQIATDFEVARANLHAAVLEAEATLAPPGSGRRCWRLLSKSSAIRGLSCPDRPTSSQPPAYRRKMPSTLWHRGRSPRVRLSRRCQSQGSTARSSSW
jgi:multidrug efflux pump subunit AcrA (membrane-fusion protein)